MNRNHCDDHQLLLFHYGELSEEGERQVVSHLRACAVCRASLDELRQTLAGVPQPDVKLSSGQLAAFNDRVLQRRRRRPMGRLPVWGGALAAAGALVVTLVVLQPGSPPAPRQTQAQADFEVLEQLDMLQDLDLLQNLDLLQAVSDTGEMG